MSDWLDNRREVRLPGATLEYRDEGEGPPVVMLHGPLCNADLWRDVVPGLARHHRCLAPDLPLGGHRIALGENADISPAGVADLVASFLAELDLEDVTLVGNDAGGALAQLVVARRPERVGRLLLASCDAFRGFPPRVLKALQPLAALPGGMRAVWRSTRGEAARRLVYRTLCHRDLEPEILSSYTAPLLADAGVRRDLEQFFLSIRPAQTLDAAKALPRFRGRAIVAWGDADLWFPRRHGRLLAALLPNARFEVVGRSRTFVPEDRPDRVAALVRELAA